MTDRAQWVAKAFADHGDLVYRVACQRLRHRQDAEDVTQEVFVRLLRSGDSGRADAALRAWLIRVTINLCVDERRSAWFRHRAGDDMLDSIPADEPEGPLDADLERALARLSADDRTILYLYYYEGYTIAEIARFLAVRTSTCSSRLSRARKKLAPWLEESI